MTRINNCLWMLMQFDIARYLLSNSHGRWDGAEKATRHIKLCNIYIATHYGGLIDINGDAYGRRERISFDLFEAIHRDTQELTNNLDTAIGFPLESRPDLDFFMPLFFKAFLKIADKTHRKYKEANNEKLD